MSRFPYSRYYVPGPSPWPFIVSLCCRTLCVRLVLWLHRSAEYHYLFLVGFLVLVLGVTFWWVDLLREGDIGVHTSYVIKSYRDGVGLFIFSEGIFFFSFFWAFFHNCLRPSTEIGCEWPPIGINVIGWNGLPLINTCLLILRGVFCTLTHKSLLIGNCCYNRWHMEYEEPGKLHEIINYDRDDTTNYFSNCWTFGVIFIFVQLFEYWHCSFTIADRVYGSTFYILTGFHGFHVIVGVSWLAVSYYRYKYGHFSIKRHFGLEACFWYWHFVDVIWLLVWLLVYFWMGGQFVDQFCNTFIPKLDFNFPTF